MKAPLILLLHSLKRARMLVFSLGALLSLFQLLMISMAASYERSGSFSQMSDLIPPFFRDIIGPSITSFMSFHGMACLGYFHPIVIGALTGLSISLGTALTAEIESGMMDLILSRPLARHWIITRAILVNIIYTAVPLVMMGMATFLGLQAISPKTAEWPRFQLILSLAANLGLLMLCWSSVALAVAAAARRRGIAGWTVGLIALAMFLLDYLARAWTKLAPIAPISPFHYFTPFDLITGKPLPVSDLGVLALIAIVALTTAYPLFARRDISH